METVKYLWEFGSLIILVLGCIHLYYTFFTNKFSAKNGDLISEMKKTSPILTDQTTMWKAWIGFNASHSFGAIFIGVINILIAIAYFDVFLSNHFYFIFNVLTIMFYLVLAKKYWFKIPFTGLLITLLCYLSAYIIVLFNS